MTQVSTIPVSDHVCCIIHDDYMWFVCIDWAIDSCVTLYELFLPAGRHRSRDVSHYRCTRHVLVSLLCGPLLIGGLEAVRFLWSMWYWWQIPIDENIDPDKQCVRVGWECICIWWSHSIIYVNSFIHMITNTHV